jgi:hypothetical protein
VKPLTNAVLPAHEIARYDSLLNAKLPTTDNKHSTRFEKNINNYDLVPSDCMNGCLGGACGVFLECCDFPPRQNFHKAAGIKRALFGE